jgi:hypothetical protein
MNFLCNSNITQISKTRNFTVDVFAYKSMFDNATGGIDNDGSDIVTTEDGGGLNDWTIALLVVVITCSSCSLVGVTVFIIRKKYLMNRARITS